MSRMTGCRSALRLFATTVGIAAWVDMEDHSTARRDPYEWALALDSGDRVEVLCWTGTSNTPEMLKACWQCVRDLTSADADIG